MSYWAARLRQPRVTQTLSIRQEIAYSPDANEMTVRPSTISGSDSCAASASRSPPSLIESGAVVGRCTVAVVLEGI